MEWHADGTRGEATVLLALRDVPAQAGPLGIVPASHRHYSERKADAANDDDNGEACACGKSDEDQVAAVMAQCGAPVWYAYRRGAPALLDARTLHAAADNGSDELRAVVWLIYTQDEEHASSADDDDSATEALAALAVGA